MGVLSPWSWPWLSIETYGDFVRWSPFHWGMNIHDSQHLPAVIMWTEGVGFWHILAHLHKNVSLDGHDMPWWISLNTAKDGFEMEISTINLLCLTVGSKDSRGIWKFGEYVCKSPTAHCALVCWGVDRFRSVLPNWFETWSYMKYTQYLDVDPQFTI